MMSSDAKTFRVIRISAQVGSNAPYDGEFEVSNEDLATIREMDNLRSQIGPGGQMSNLPRAKFIDNLDATYEVRDLYVEGMIKNPDTTIFYFFCNNFLEED
jgi:hypothetical protein